MLIILPQLVKWQGTDQSTFDNMYAGYQKSSFKVKAETLEDTSKNKDMTNQTGWVT